MDRGEQTNLTYLTGLLNEAMPELGARLVMLSEGSPIVGLQTVTGAPHAFAILDAQMSSWTIDVDGLWCLLDTFEGDSQDVFPWALSSLAQAASSQLEEASGYGADETAARQARYSALVTAMFRPPHASIVPPPVAEVVVKDGARWPVSIGVLVIVAGFVQLCGWLIGLPGLLTIVLAIGSGFAALYAWASSRPTRAAAFLAGSILLVVVAGAVFPFQPATRTSVPPTSPTALCRDGTYSYAAHRQGTCSWRDGVAFFYK